MALLSSVSKNYKYLHHAKNPAIKYDYVDKTHSNSNSYEIIEKINDVPWYYKLKQLHAN